MDDSDPALALFDRMLAADKGRWISSIPAFQDALLAANCHYARRPFVKVLRPKFLRWSEYAHYDYVSAVLMGLFRRLADMVQDSPELMDYLAFTEGERRLVAPEPRCPDPCPFTRLDSFMTPTGPRFVELNGEAPAGTGFNDAAMDVFRTHPLIQDFMERTGAWHVDTKQGVLNGLLQVWRMAGERSRPTILITDYDNLPTVPEFLMLREFFEKNGFEAIYEDPRNLTFQQGKLIAKGRAVDLVYRRVLTTEFLEREDQVRPLFEAYAAGAVVMVNPFRAKTIHKKACFALLSGDLLGQGWMTRQERAVVNACIPWTRKVRDGKTTHRDQEVDLLAFAALHRDQLVLKPSDEYGGKGVSVGWETDATTWERLLSDAATGNQGEYVLQARIQTYAEPFPMLEQGLEAQPMIVDLDPYIYLGRVYGMLARLAAGALCNVTSGGGQVPVLILPDHWIPRS